jgi:hypothetical protein
MFPSNPWHYHISWFKGNIPIKPVALSFKVVKKGMFPSNPWHYHVRWLKREYSHQTRAISYKVVKKGMFPSNPRHYHISWLKKEYCHLLPPNLWHYHTRWLKRDYPHQASDIIILNDLGWHPLGHCRYDSRFTMFYIYKNLSSWCACVRARARVCLCIQCIQKYLLCRST